MADTDSDSVGGEAALQQVQLQVAKLRQLLTCTLCQNVVKLATCLCCNHHFCMVCIQEFIRANDACCPKCKLPATSNQAKFSPEFESIIEVYRALEVASNKLSSDISYIANQMSSNRLKLKLDKTSLDQELKGSESHNDGRNEVSSLCRGFSPMSKRVQLPGPPKTLEDAQEKNIYSAKQVLPPIFEHVSECTTKLDEHGENSVNILRACANVSCEGIDEYNIQNSSVEDVSDTPKMKDRLCLRLRNCKGGLVVSNLVGTVADLDEDVNAHGSQGKGLKRKAADCKTGNLDKKSKKALLLDEITCAFCQTANDSPVAGQMMHYEKGVPVKSGNKVKSLLSVHQFCAEWAPNVYYVGDEAKNLSKEVARGQKLKCSLCGLKGATLGCYVKCCLKSYHYPCARSLACRWDTVNFLALCPEHVSERLPNDTDIPQLNIENNEQVPIVSYTHLEGNNSAEIEGHVNEVSENKVSTEIGDGTNNLKLGVAEVAEIPKISLNPWSSIIASEWMLCSSGLNEKSRVLLDSFLSQTRVKYTSTWSPHVTHLIVGTNKSGAANRTLKFLMATLSGAWVLKSDWLDACMAAKQPVSEQPFEVSLDIHGMVDGPKNGRLKAAAKAQKLFEGLGFYFLGDYAADYKTNLEALITAGGGMLLATMQDPPDSNKKLCKFVIYSKDPFPYNPKACNVQEIVRNRYKDAKALASKLGAHAIGHPWILDSIAASELQPLDEKNRIFVKYSNVELRAHCAH